MSNKPFAAATDRNAGPILDVLQREFAGLRSVLEIGSGTGQHAVRFATAMPQLEWQPSDLRQHCPGMKLWFDEAALPNIAEPLVLDVQEAHLEQRSYDAVFSANTAHIMSFEAVEHMFALVGDVLRGEGRFCLYGPFRQHGRFNTHSNAEFHRSLRQRDPAMGIRHLEDLDALASAGQLQRTRLYAMPANNHLVVWQKHHTLSPLSD